MNGDVAKRKKRNSLERVEEPRPDVVDDAPLVKIMPLIEYIEETEIPILSEYCAYIGVYEDIFKKHCDDEKTQFLLKILENKKRAALERKIYSGELNATIGGQLLKRWNEEMRPEEKKPTHIPLTIYELAGMGLPDGHAEIVHETLLQLSIKKNMTVELRLPE
jgi:hypothetical protein